MILSRLWGWTSLVLVIVSQCAAATPPSLTVLSQQHSESRQKGGGCVKRLAGGSDSYWNLKQDSTQKGFDLTSQVFTTALATVGTTLLQIPCWGAGGTAGDTWGWSIALRLNGDPGAVADVHGKLLTQWFRQLIVIGPGLTNAVVHADVRFFFKGPGGDIPAAAIALDQSEDRTAIGEQNSTDWLEEKDYHVGGMKVGDPVFGTLFVEGHFKASSTVDLTNFFPGGLTTLSSALFLLSGDVVQTQQLPPTIAKAFGAARARMGESTALSFIITNLNASGSLTGVGFTDPLPAGLVISTPNALSGDCGGGTIAAPAGSGTVGLTGATLNAGASCTFTLNVTATSPGPKNNTTGPVTSVEAGSGGSASATLIVDSQASIPTLQQWALWLLILLVVIVTAGLAPRPHRKN